MNHFFQSFVPYLDFVVLVAEPVSSVFFVVGTFKESESLPPSFVLGRRRVCVQTRTSWHEDGISLQWGVTACNPHGKTYALRNAFVQVVTFSVRPSKRTKQYLDTGHLFTGCPTDPDSVCTMVKFDNRPAARLDGLLNFFMILFVVMVLSAGSLLFAGDCRLKWVCLVLINKTHKLPQELLRSLQLNQSNGCLLWLESSPNPCMRFGEMEISTNHTCLPYLTPFWWSDVRA
jgi:hypothetical protein